MASARMCRCLQQLCTSKLLGKTTGEIQRRGYRQWRFRYLKSLYHRRLEQGPEPDRHRSEWINWNYEAELFAFGKRLGEDFQTETLTRALTHRSYIDKEEKTRVDLGIDTEALPLGLEDNEDLAARGEEICHRYIAAYLRHLYPDLYEEGVKAVTDTLMSDETLSHVARHIGISDLMLCADFPPEDSTLSKTFKAVVGALEVDQDLSRAEVFVRDFVLPQLVGRDLSEMWTVINPMGLLTSILQAQKRGLPEPRLLFQSGAKTIMSLYYVGIYSNKELIGQSPGETVTIAEEMAARDALWNLMKIGSNRTPLVFSSLADNMKLDYDKRNPSLASLNENLSRQKETA